MGCQVYAIAFGDQGAGHLLTRPSFCCYCFSAIAASTDPGVSGSFRRRAPVA